jgi:tRNA 2-selenouridine synthase
VEDESRTIGKKVIPEPVWQQMLAAPLIVLDRPMEERIKYLVEEYGKFPKEELAASILKIRKRLGGLAFQQALEALDNNELAVTARILLDYYDKAYAMSLNHRQPEHIQRISVEGIDNNEIARQIVALYKRTRL